MRWFACPDPAAPWLSATDFADFVHRMRHEFLSLLTPVSGWLQLANPERALVALDSVIASIRVDSGWSSLHDPDLEGALFVAKAEAKTAGLDLVAHFAAGQAGPTALAVLEAAAAMDQAPSPSRPGPAPGSPASGSRTAAFARAVLALVRALIALRRPLVLKGRCPTTSPLPAVIDAVPGGWRMILDLPPLPLATEALRRLEDQVLLEAGFVAAPAGGRVPADGRRPVPDGRRPVANGAPLVGVELEITAAPEPPQEKPARAGEDTQRGLSRPVWPPGIASRLTILGPT